MLGKTHKAAGIALAINAGVFSGLGIIDSLIMAGITAVAAVAPDIDIRFKSLRHRSITHSLFAGGAVATLAYLTNPKYAVPVVVGYMSHIGTDMLTKHGVELLWPYPKTFGLRWIKTGDLKEKAIYAVLWMYIFYNIIV